MNSVNIYLLEVKNKTLETKLTMKTKLMIRTPKRRQWRRSGDFIVVLNILYTLF